MTDHQEKDIVNKETYTYTYSASQQEEIEHIRRKYLPTDKKQDAEDDLSRLRRIETKVERAGVIPALILGIIGTLLLGIALCCVLVWMGIWFYIGIPVGIVGIGIMVIAYPLYVLITRCMRRKYAKEVLSIGTEE